MEPSEIREETLKQLQQTVLQMTSPEWDLALEGEPEEQVKRAKKELLRVQAARLSLENAQLAEIRDKLIQNDAALEQGRQRLSWALQNLQQVQSVLEAVSSFLDIASRVVAFV